MRRSGEVSEIRTGKPMRFASAAARDARAVDDLKAICPQRGADCDFAFPSRGAREKKISDIRAGD